MFILECYLSKIQFLILLFLYGYSIFMNNELYKIILCQLVLVILDFDIVYFSNLQLQLLVYYFDNEMIKIDSVSFIYDRFFLKDIWF